MTRARNIDEYLNIGPQDQRSELEQIKRLIEKNLPAARPGIGPGGFPEYTIGKQWRAGFAYKPTGPVIYLMAPELLAEYEEDLKPVRASKTCLRYQSARGLPFGKLQHIIMTILQRINEQAG